MTLKVRRILSSIFILLFFIITPAIVLYAAGLKINKNDFSIQRTGMFIIDSKPRGAEIFLNGQAQKTLINSLLHRKSFVTTPARIKNLLPGEYNLSLKLDGYWGWQKKLTIDPGSSTFAENIYLFKNDLPVQIFSEKIESMYFSPNKNQAIIQSAEQTVLINLADETKEFIGQVGSKIDNAVWSNDGSKLVINSYLYNLRDLSSKTDLSKLTAGSFDYKWNDSTLFFRDKTAIYRLDNKNLSKKITSSPQFDDYLIKDGNLYLIKQAESAAILEVINLTSNDTIKKINLPLSANYSFINSENVLLNLYDNDHQILYLIDPLVTYYSPLIEIINDVKTTFWVDDKSLLYANDFEIWLYDLTSETKTLITRMSQTINSLVMHPNRNYIIYTTDKTINAIELDEREKRNTSELMKFDLINAFVLNAKGNILYFSGRIGNAAGLYKLFIQ